MAALPSVSDATHLLKGLFRRGVDVSDTAAPPAPFPFVGTYVDQDDQPCAQIRSDIGFAASSAAAFAQIPAGVVKESVANKVLDETLAEIFGEVLNVLSRLLANRDSERVKLADKDVSGAGSTPLPTIGQALHLFVDVDGYAAGRISLYVF